MKTLSFDKKTRTFGITIKGVISPENIDALKKLASMEHEQIKYDDWTTLYGVDKLDNIGPSIFLIGELEDSGFVEKCWSWRDGPCVPFYKISDLGKVLLKIIEKK